MNIKKIITSIIIIILVADVGVFLSTIIHSNANAAQKNSQTAAVKSVDSSIIANGTITAQDQATLHFQTGGKLVSLPLKEGDTVTQGQMIAQLDTYAMQQQLAQAVNTYKSTQDTFNQTQENQQAGVVAAQQRTSLDTTVHNNADYSGTTEESLVQDAAKRFIDQGQLNLNSASLNVDIARYALQMATLTSPLTGVITHEDVTVAGQNVTPTTSFTVADPTTEVFRANIPANYIDFVSEGMNASVILDGVQQKINGTIVKIYPSKVTLADGESVYQVDIQSDQIKNTGKLDQAGTAIIMTNAQNVMLIPAWTVLNGKYVWVDNNGKPQLKTVSVGAIHGNMIEITGGLSKDDRVITDPKSIPSKEYQIL